MTDRWQTLAAVDADKWACATYRANFPGVNVMQAMVADALPSLPACDVILGGPPLDGRPSGGMMRVVSESVMITFHRPGDVVWRSHVHRRGSDTTSGIVGPSFFLVTHGLPA